MKRQGLFTISAKLKLAINFLLLYGREDSGEILESVWQEEENFEVLKRCYKILAACTRVCRKRLRNLF